jgi:hypothetical protein
MFILHVSAFARYGFLHKYLQQFLQAAASFLQNHSDVFQSLFLPFRELTIDETGHLHVLTVLSATDPSTTFIVEGTMPMFPDTKMVPLWIVA